jgi:lysophospholipase L1-like esterase
MLEEVHTRAGEFKTRTFIVNVRTPAIPGGDRVRLKQRERENEMVAWDDKLTLEFNGDHPSLATLEIAPTNVPTVYLLGDSTVCDQPREPWNSWGQMLTRFFGPGVAVANHSQSGESIRSSLGANRFDKVFSLIKPGDYLFLQFGHNDMKDRAPDALATYESNLKMIVEQTREKGATPVLVTSMERKAGVNSPTLQGYPDTVCDVAREDDVALIDLNDMSLQLYRALGEDLDRAFQDGTHHNAYGSYQLAQCVVEGIRTSGLPLAKLLAEDVVPFDPAQPDPVAAFGLPASPDMSELKPEGN